MSFASLSGNAAFSDPNQLPALLEYLEGNVSRLYDDGQGNPTIGIGLNLANADNMAIVLNLMAPSLFSGQSDAFVQSVVSAFETVIGNNKLPTGVSSDGLVSPVNQYSQTKNLQSLLNELLAGYLDIPVSQLGSSFTSFSQASARTALQEALTGGNVVPGYPTITGYSQAALNWLQGENPKHIDVTANIPGQNTGAWEALVSLFFNQSSA